MKDKKRRKLKKRYFHPVTIFILLTIGLILLSKILSLLEMQGTYYTINPNTKELESTLVTVENILSSNGIKFIIGSAMKNFLSFSPLGTILISLIGLAIAEGTGFIETISKRYVNRIPKMPLTFIVIFIATISSLINDVGFAILIPMVALIYFIIGRNPILGIITSYCGVAFGYGVSLFVGSTEIALIETTEQAAKLIDSNSYIRLSSNLIFIVVASIILSIVGTFIIEKIISPKIGKYKREEEFAKTEQYNVIDLEEEEQKEKEKEKNQKRGIKFALVVSIIFILLVSYSLIPGLPYSGLLLDMDETLYANQLFGENAYIQNGFTYLVALFFTLAGIAYAFGSKSISNDKDLIENIKKSFSKNGELFVLLFVISQFIAIYKKTNIGIIITCWLTTLLGNLSFSGIPLIVITMIFIAIANMFYTGSSNKWLILSPVVVPMFMQNNLSPSFAQIILRAGDSMTNGYTILLASFAIYIAYLNQYNLNKEKPYTIRGSLQLITPYFLIISLTWILLVIGWYIVGLPIGPKVFPTI